MQKSIGKNLEHWSGSLRFWLLRQTQNYRNKTEKQYGEELLSHHNFNEV